MDQLSPEQIAEVCHEANRAIQRILGEQVNFPWENTGPDIRDSLLSGVEKLLSGEVTTPEESHEAWCAYKQQQGWEYGPVKNFATKQHPQLVPYESLPAEQKLKDRLFFAIVEVLRPPGAVQ